MSTKESVLCLPLKDSAKFRGSF